MPKDMTVKRQSKNSVFVKFFNNEENILQLYKELHPEAVDVTVDDIKIDTIDSVMVNTLYNDLGFLVRDTYILLFEAQSTWSKNIALRMFLYLAETIRRYINATGQSELDDVRVKLPTPELYVIYSGGGKKTDAISLSEDFFGGNPDIELKVHVLSEVNSTLPGQYIGFCKVFDEQRKLYNDGQTIACETYRICIEKGYLTEFMKAHETEVIDMMKELFDEDTMRKQLEVAKGRRYVEIGFKKGIEKGETKGKISVARNLLALGAMSQEDIAAATGLKLEKIRELSADTPPAASI